MSMMLVVRAGDRTITSFDLVDGCQLVLGSSNDADCSITGQKHVSRQHAILRPRGRRLGVQRIMEAANPILFNGKGADLFEMKLGDFFVIGETCFCFEAEPNQEFTLEPEELHAPRPLGDRFLLLDLMELPEVLRTKNRQEFFCYACAMLRKAAAAQLARVLTIQDESPITLTEDTETDQQGRQPHSRSLIADAVEQSPRPVAYTWNQAADMALAATQHEGIDWAVACAIHIPGEAPIIIYLSGAEGGVADHPGAAGSLTSLRDIARMVGLVSDTIGRAISLEKMETWQSRLQHYFPKALTAKILAADATETLAPKISEATIMFFDIRGFSKRAEDNLHEIIEHQRELKHVMTVMTQCIFDHHGIVLQYAGDGIMACWNVPHATPNHAEMACRAALSMVEQIEEVTHGWKCGIGLHAGEVVAGSSGSDQIYAYAVFGPVVNLTSRVEGITKIVGEPVLVTGAVSKRLSDDDILPRRVARFRPVGVRTEIDLYTIHRAPKSTKDRADLEARFETYGQALAAFVDGDWRRAEEVLHPLVPYDAASKYLYSQVLSQEPPETWNGVVKLASK